MYKSIKVVLGQLPQSGFDSAVKEPVGNHGSSSSSATVPGCIEYGELLDRTMAKEELAAGLQRKCRTICGVHFCFVTGPL
jgi:hypothetical protein